MVCLHLEIVIHVDSLPGFIYWDSTALAFLLESIPDFGKSFNLFLVMEIADPGVETTVEVQAVPVEQFNFLFIPGLLLAK